MVPGRGLEPPRCYPLVPETSASTNSATRAGVRRAAKGTHRVQRCQFLFVPDRCADERMLSSDRSHPYGSQVGATTSKYLIAAALAIAAIVLRWALTPVLADWLPLVTLYGAVTFSVWRCGVGPAVFTALVGYAGCHWLFVVPF